MHDYLYLSLYEARRADLLREAAAARRSGRTPHPERPRRTHAAARTRLRFVPWRAA